MLCDLSRNWLIRYWVKSQLRILNDTNMDLIPKGMLYRYQNFSVDGLKTLERVKLEKSWNYKIVVDCRRDAQTKSGLLNFPTTFLDEKTKCVFAIFIICSRWNAKGNVLFISLLATQINIRRIIGASKSRNLTSLVSYFY